MAGPMARMYGAATMVGKDEMNGRINPAMEPDDDLPIVEAQKNKPPPPPPPSKKSPIGGGGGHSRTAAVPPGLEKGHTAF